MTSQFDSFIQHGEETQQSQSQHTFQFPSVEQLLPPEEPQPVFNQQQVQIETEELPEQPIIYEDVPYEPMEYTTEMIDPVTYVQQQNINLITMIDQLRTDVNKLQTAMEAEEEPMEDEENKIEEVEKDNDIEPKQIENKPEKGIIRPKLPDKPENIRRLLPRKIKRKKHHKPIKIPKRSTELDELPTTDLLEGSIRKLEFKVPNNPAFILTTGNYGIENLLYICKKYLFSTIQCVHTKYEIKEKLIQNIFNTQQYIDDLLFRNSIQIPSTDMEVFQLKGDIPINPSNSKRYFTTLFVFIIILKAIVTGTQNSADFKFLMNFGNAIHSKYQNRKIMSSLTDYFVSKKNASEMSKIDLIIDDVHLQANSFIAHSRLYPAFIVYFRVVYTNEETFILTNVEAVQEQIDILNSNKTIVPPSVNSNYMLQQPYWSQEFNKQLLPTIKSNENLSPERLREVNWASTFRKMPNSYWLFNSTDNLNVEMEEIKSEKIKKGKSYVDVRSDYRTFDIGFEFLLPITIYDRTTGITTRPDRSVGIGLEAFDSLEMEHINAILGIAVHTIWNIQYSDAEIAPEAEYKKRPSQVKLPIVIPTPGEVNRRTSTIIDNLQMPDTPQDYKENVDEEINVTKE